MKNHGSLKLFVSGKYWTQSSTSDQIARKLADRHYSRQKVGSYRFTPPGATLILVGENKLWAVVVSKYRQDNLAGTIVCTIFRNESDILSSELIIEATQLSLEHFKQSIVYTYIDPTKIKSVNPGCCFFKAGYIKAGYSKKKKLLLLKYIMED